MTSENYFMLLIGQCFPLVYASHWPMFPSRLLIGQFTILDFCKCHRKVRIYLPDRCQQSTFYILYSRNWISKPFHRIEPKVFRLCPFCNHILQWKLFHVIACTCPKIRILKGLLFLIWSTYTSKFQESVLHINVRSAPLRIESITDASALLVHFTVFDIVAAASFDFLFMNSLRILCPLSVWDEVWVNIGWGKMGKPKWESLGLLRFIP